MTFSSICLNIELHVFEVFRKPPCLCVLPWNLLDEPLHRNGQLTQETLDDWTTFSKLVFHLDVQDVRHQRHKRVFL